MGRAWSGPEWSSNQVHTTCPSPHEAQDAAIRYQPIRHPVPMARRPARMAHQTAMAGATISSTLDRFRWNSAVPNWRAMAAAATATPAATTARTKSRVDLGTAAASVTVGDFDAVLPPLARHVERVVGPNPGSRRW